MNAIKSIYLLAIFLITSTQIQATTPDWGKTGHRAIGEIAENYLSKKAKRKITALLNGQSLAMVANFGDDIKSDKRYNKFYTWHYVNKPFGVAYKDAKKNKRGDLLTGIQQCIKIISSKESSKADQIFYLKLLVHFVGDLHQPMHVGRAEDKGGNSIKVKWFYSKTNLHSVWDSKMIDHYQMSYTELTQNANQISKDQVQYLQQGTVEDWVNETGKLAEKVRPAR